MKLLLFIGCLFTLIFGEELAQKCASDNGIFCECNVENSKVKIWNCIRPGGWSTWSKWSKCREGTRKRRRTCNNPQPIGTACVGQRVEKKTCAAPVSVPEYLFGTWTEWNPWSRCDCDRNMRTRTRHCQGESCEGCDNQHDTCRSDECAINKKWSEWTDWTEYGKEQVRYSAWCSSPSVKNVEVGWRKESQESTKYVDWSEWHVYPGVAYRYRILRNSTITVEHHFLSRSTTSCLPLYFAIPIFCFSILTGFLLQVLIMCIISKCKEKCVRHSYSSYDSNPRDFPSHLVRSPKDESVW